MTCETDAAAAGQQPGRRGALCRCIACPTSEFASQYWGQRPLLARCAELPRGFADLLDPAAVDELVSRRGLRTPFLRMARDGTVIPEGRYTRGGGAGATIADQAADDRVLALLADGATLVLQGLHRTWPPLVGFASELAAELGHPVQINAYVTPAQNQGFAAHYDVHDVFVLQVVGRKRWRIHEPVLTDPLGDQPWEQRRAEVQARAGEPPLIDAVLEPGDALYLPRGYLHSAAALGETTIHLTVGVHPLTRYQLARHLLAAAADERALRASLPVGVDLADPALLAPHLRAAVDALRAAIDRADVAAVADRVAADLARQTRAAPIGPLAQIDAAGSLTGDTPLRLRPGLRCRVSHEPDGIRLRLADRSVTVSPTADDALKTLLAGAPFTPAQLPGMSAHEQRDLAVRLLREGIVVPA